MKLCTRCNNEKPLTEFTKDKFTPDGLDRKCRKCKAELYNRIDKTERKAWRRKYYETHYNKELQKCADYRIANRDARNAYIAEYYRQRPYLVAAKAAKYRAAKLQAMPKWLSTQQLLEIVEIYKGRPDGYDVDHIVPLQGKQVRGLHVPWNLQYLPANINKRKSNKLTTTSGKPRT